MYFGQLTHKGIRTESAAATFELDASIDGYDKVGLPVAMKGNFLVGLAGDGDAIVGYLESYEERKADGTKTGAVSWNICAEWTYTGTAPVVGGGVVGSATEGAVKAAVAPAGLNALVTAVDTTNKIVSVILR